MSSSNKRILFSANDPGGANTVLPVVEALKTRGDMLLGIVSGPAVTQFQGIGEIRNGSDLSDGELQSAIHDFKPDLFLAASSMGNSIDKRVHDFVATTPSVYVIDFWSHYQHRFAKIGQEDTLKLPTRICVIDERMKDEMVAEGFPEATLVITGNPYFDHFAEGITRESEDNHKILFISQPIRADKKQAGYIDLGTDEFDALELLLKELPPGMHVAIRLHPRDERDKFDLYLSDCVSVDQEPTLEIALSKAGLILGIYSPVLMQAAFAGKPVISYQPKGTEEDALPTNERGITKRVCDQTELREALASYASGTFNSTHVDPAAIWPTRATERVVEVIDAILNR
jgi:hypothetical protein